MAAAFIMSKAAKAAKRVGGGNLGTVGTLALVKLKAANGGMLGALRVFVVCSAVLDDHLWVVIDRNFEPRDALAKTPAAWGRTARK